MGAGERMDGVHRQGCAWGRGGKQGSPFPAAAPSRLLKGLKDLSSYAYQAPCPCIARKFFKRGGREFIFHGDRVSFWDEEKVRELDGGEGGIAV